MCGLRNIITAMDNDTQCLTHMMRIAKTHAQWNIHKRDVMVRYSSSKYVLWPKNALINRFINQALALLNQRRVTRLSWKMVFMLRTLQVISVQIMQWVKTDFLGNSFPGILLQLSCQSVWTSLIKHFFANGLNVQRVGFKPSVNVALWICDRR